MSQTHESLQEFHRPDPPSERSFGLLVGGILAVLGFWPAVVRHAEPRYWLLIPGAVLVILGAFWPATLRLPNRWWMQLAMALSRITNPLITGLMFFLVFTPMGLLLRLMGKDLLRKRLDPAAGSYWIVREPGSTDPSGMRNQF